MRTTTNGARDPEVRTARGTRGERTTRGGARVAIALTTIALTAAALAGCGSGTVTTSAPERASTEPSSLAQGVDANPDARPARAVVDALSAELTAALTRTAGSPDAFVLPDSDDFAAIPQDPSNPLSADNRVALGRLLFHDTGFALGGRSAEAGTWSCATCHHAAAGFKAGARQGIGEGGTGFGPDGAERTLASGFDAHAAADAAERPDLQPVASPTVLNAAWQDVMLWNGQFGNGADGVNADVDPGRLLTAGTPKATNARGLSGLETQAIAGTGVHRLSFDVDSPLRTVPEYRTRFAVAFGHDPANAPPGADVAGDAGLAIAAFERTVIANRAPFQRWLRGGDRRDGRDRARRCRALFFGEAGCADCHRGPALGSERGAGADRIFFALGFDDLDADPAGAHGAVDGPTRLGRGGFTGRAHERHAFKIPPLYNLADAGALGHGASFASVREVVEYKNAGAVQHPDVPAGAIDPRHRPLGLDELEVDALVAFLETGLRDPDLSRYEPASVPSGSCTVVGTLPACDRSRIEPSGR